MKNITKLIENTLDNCQMRVVGMRTETMFGDTIVYVNIHISDLRWGACSTEELTEKLKEAGVNCMMEHEEMNVFRIKLLDKA